MLRRGGGSPEHPPNRAPGARRPFRGAALARAAWRATGAGGHAVPHSATELPKRRVTVNGHQMACVEMGSGDPIVFLHGNPTSSYLWRNVMPHVAELGRCIAPDLIGMGDSDKLPDSGPDRYRYVEHREYLDGFFAALGLAERVVLVIHDWGGALGLDWARRHSEAVRGICYMEAVVRPMTWAEFPAAGEEVFRALRSPAGEAMVLEQNLFVEQLLPAFTLRKFGEDEMAVYRRPYAEPGEGRRPTLTWPRQIPLDGTPADVVAATQANADWLGQSAVPKLFVRGEPGALVTGALLEFCRGFPAQREVAVPGSHFLQEDSPDEIGAALRDWLGELN